MYSTIRTNLTSTARLFITLTALASAHSCLAASEVYKEVDEDGVPSFSDQISPDAVKIEVKDPQTFESDEFAPPEYEYTPREQAPTGIDYLAKIVSPAHDSAIRNNAGSLTVSVSIKPALAPGHKAALLLDGGAVEGLNGNGGSVTLNNVDRGTHVLSVQIRNNKGKIVETSKPVSVTLLRHSRN